MTIAQSSAFVQRVEEIKGFGLWILSRPNFKGMGSEKFRGKGRGGVELKRKSKVKQELVWGSEGREEEQAAQKGEDRERERETDRQTDRHKMVPGAIFSFWNGNH